MDSSQSKLTLPLSIVAAGVIIAGAIFLSKGPTTPDPLGLKNNTSAKVGEISFTAVNEKDKIVGNPDAPIILVEYSDLECPACKYFHSILNQMMDEYGKSGKVAWVFRHYPIAGLHSKAPKEAEAAECVYELGGNQKFWNFINKVFEITPANNGLDSAQLPVIASEVGIDKEKFNTCLNSGKYATAVATSNDEGTKVGVAGTPTSFLILKTPLSEKRIKDLQIATSAFVGQRGEPLVVVLNDGGIVSIGAAFPYDGLKIILDAVLEN